jgi:hypothetical protein
MCTVRSFSDIWICGKIFICHRVMSNRIKVRFFPSTHYCITYCVQENININSIDLDLLRLYCGPYFYSTILVLCEHKKD